MICTCVNIDLVQLPFRCPPHKAGLAEEEDLAGLHLCSLLIIRVLAHIEIETRRV